MKKLILLTTLCGSLVTFTSCKKQLDNSINFIPTEASSVALINVKQIKEKNTNFSGVIDYLAGETDETIKKIYNSGIDLDKSIFTYVGKLDEDTPYYGAFFSISDKDKFQKTLENELNSSSNTEGELTIFTLPKKKGIITWKENTGVWINIPDEKLALELLTNNNEANTLINTNENFKKSFTNDNDLTLWVDLEQITSIAHHLDPKIAAIQDEADLSNSFLISNINFENGEITLDNDFEGNDNNFTKYADIYNGSLNKSLLKHASGDNLVLAYLLNLNIKEVFNTIEKEDGLTNEVDNFLSRFNVTSGALEEALSGEVIMTVNGLEGFIPFNYKASIVLGVKNEEKTNEILNNLSSYGLIYDSEKEQYESSFLLAKVEDDALLLAGPDIDFAKTLLEGEGKKLSEIDIDNANGEMVLNIDAIPKSFLNNISKQFPIINEVKSLSTSTEMKENKVIYRVVLKLKNEEQNALSIISQHTKELL